MEIKSIDKFFLNTILTISIIGVLIILIIDVVFFPEDVFSIMLDSIILLGCLVGYFVRNHYPTVAILIITNVVLAAMAYQCLFIPVNTNVSLSIILVVGFIFSVMLKGRVMWLMHGITIVLLNSIFIVQYSNPELRFTSNLNELVTVATTYAILYFILTYATAVLKSSYNRIHQHLHETNEELKQKATEIALQNRDLEKTVSERTAKIQMQNETLIKYSYTNAHHLRGPVARLLGLANVYKTESIPDPNYFIDLMVDQAHQIDTVIKKINIDLAASNVGD